jgi:hypothetical protein
MIRLLLRLYPGRWRARYGAEFAALLKEHALAPYDVLDVLFGALDAHLHLRRLGAGSTGARGYRMSVRIGAYAALWTGILWFFGVVGYNPVFIAASGIAYILAVTGLSYNHPGVRATRIWPPAAIGIIGGAMSTVGALAVQLNGWNIAWTLGYPMALLVIGIGIVQASSLLFAVSLLRDGTAGRRVARFLLVGSALGVATMAASVLVWASAFPPFVPAGAIEVFSAVAMIWFATGWIGVGLDVLLRDLVATQRPTPSRRTI